MDKFVCCFLSLAALAPAARAQTAIEIYGVVDLSVVSDRDSGKSMMKVDSGQQTASRLGFKDSEALGNGLSTNFVIESQIEADRGALSYAGRLFGSQAWVGLSGPFGSFKLGRIFPPYFGAIATTAPFDAKGPGESTRVFQDSGGRMDNTIKYSLPPGLNGFYADLAYGAGESAGGYANRQFSMDAGVAAGPFNIELAYHNTNDAFGANLVCSHLVGGNIDFGAARGWLMLPRNRNGGTLDTRNLLLGISIPFGRSSIAADLVRKQDRALRNADVTQLAIAYYYTLSKRSNVYLIASGLNNDAAANYQASAPGGARGILAGDMRHQF